MILATLLVISATFYLRAVVIILKGWNSIETVKQRDNKKKVSVIVVYRNEESHLDKLIDSLINQEYPDNLFEIIFVDDHSDDDSFAVIQRRISSFSCLVKHLRLPTELTGKKNGITYAINEACHDWILGTDADCTFGQDWISIMASYSESLFVSGPVAFESNSSVWGKMIELDFISLITIGAGLISKEEPVLANGANMLYHKKSFEAVGGFDSGHNLASGDDVFLLEKIGKLPHNNVRFVKDERAIVTTTMPSDLKAFIQQRIRWAKKSKYATNTRSNTSLLALVQFYLIFVFCLVVAATTHQSVLLWTIVIVFLAKLLADLRFFWKILPFYKKRTLLPYVILVDFLHPVYMIIIAVLSWCMPVKWKKRTHKYG